MRTFLQLQDELGGARHLVVLVVAYGRRANRVPLQEPPGAPRVLAGDEIHSFERADGPESYVL